MTRTLTRIATAALISAGSVVAMSAPAVAHPHSAQNGQPIADGQLHPKFKADGTSCEEYGTPSGDPVGPAWYGLETAHHGPDQGAPGKDDGCYQTETKPNPNGPGWVPENDTNPGIN